MLNKIIKILRRTLIFNESVFISCYRTIDSFQGVCRSHGMSLLTTTTIGGRVSFDGGFRRILILNVT